MKYQSKKDPNITAAYDFKDPKTKTIRMIYLTGEKAGYSFEISSSTLKMWWEEMPATEQEVEAEIINTPYHPDVTPHYIKKPQSVIDYENNKVKARYNMDLPQFSDMVNDLQHNLQKVSETSKYVMVKDSKTTLWRKARWIDVYADEPMWEKLVEQGFESAPNKDKERPFAIRVKTLDEYEKLKNVIG